MSDISKPIPPTASIKKYLNETVELEQFRRSGKKTFDGSSIGSKKLAEVKLRLRNNDDAKGRAIDNLFESMANLIYFFQFVNSHPEIMYRFKEDIENLLGITGQDVSKIDAKDPPFARLIREFIGEEHDDTNFQYRTRLLHIMQFLINHKSDWVMMKNDVPSKNDYEMRSMMITDMKRAEVWMGYIDKFSDREEKPRRVLEIPKS
jgi:hypothetical protein